jgi:GST-like protein
VSAAAGGAAAHAAPDEYVLYGKLGTGAASVHAALELAGARYRRVDAASWEPDAAFEELLAVNPIGQIPTLRLPDGPALSESAAILIHLAERFPAARLLPVDDAARAQVIRGLVYIAANCYPCITIIDYPERFCAGADGDDALKERIRAGTRERLHKHWDIFADLFGPQPFLAGPHIGALDLYAATVSRWAGARAHVRERRPAFHAALMRIEAHPTVAAVFAQHWPPKA